MKTSNIKIEFARQLPNQRKPASGYSGHSFAIENAGTASFNVSSLSAKR